jgi:F-type H+-transporting ATPase subunit gamma
MTGRLADISARLEGINQLGAVVNAMRGIAAARAQQARGQLTAVDLYAGTIAAAIGRVLDLLPTLPPGGAKRRPRTALVAFCAEQGFAGGFSERVFNAMSADLAGNPGDIELFLIGSRGAMLAAERNIAVAWKSAMPSHSPGVPALADRIAEALYARITAGTIDRLDMIFTSWQPGHGIAIERHRLFPYDWSEFTRSAADRNPPLVNLTPAALLSELAAAYLHARLCNAALHAFAAENEARMEVMASAHSQIDRQLAELQATQRQVRQEEITAEIIELASGEIASQTGPENSYQPPEF